MEDPPPGPIGTAAAAGAGDGIRLPSRGAGWRALAPAVFATLALAAPAALGHAGERGFIMLLPTRLFQAGGALAVAVSFLVVMWIRPGIIQSLLTGRRLRLFPVPPRVPGTNVAAAAVLVGLVAAGFAGSRDPLLNPLPLAVWTLLWVGLTLAHAVLGHLWPHLNPWTPLAALARRGLGRRPGDDAGLFALPAALGEWPAVFLLLGFAWFELCYPAPRDPAILAAAVAGYSAFTVAGMVLFGDRAWSRRAEVFSRFFHMVSRIAPLRTEAAGDGGRRLAVTFPGARLVGMGALTPGGVAFVVVALATVSFDGLSRTFWWLDLAGANPLEHPGRTALLGASTASLAAAALVLLGAYAAAAAGGARWAGLPPGPALRRLVVSVVPIAIGYHMAHYLPSFLVDVQHAVKALSDPLGRGWNLLGVGEMHVTASFLTHHASVELLWYVQVGIIVAAHVAAVVVLHGLAGESAPGRRASVLCELPLTALMIAYTLFGLWLLSTPVAT